LLYIAFSLLQTSTSAPKVEEKKGGGIFCGMSLSEALIAAGILALFFFFVVSTVAHSLILPFF
jgi:hypothetical protein